MEARANKHLTWAREWTRAAIIDDWTAVDHKDGMLTLERDGFRAIATLDPLRPSIKVWGPDKLGICVPEHYSWRACLDALKRCDRCVNYVGPTYGIGFADRVCGACKGMLGEKYHDEITKDFLT